MFLRSGFGAAEANVGRDAKALVIEPADLISEVRHGFECIQLTATAAASHTRAVHGKDERGTLVSMGLNSSYRFGCGGTGLRFVR
jgi:hypothetical protein